MTRNLFQSIPGGLPEELVDVLVDHAAVRIERIVSDGHASPPDFWYDQAEHEWVVLLRGQARLRFDDGSLQNMSAGDHVMIPARCRHRVDWTSEQEPTIWLTVFFSANDNSATKT